MLLGMAISWAGLVPYLTQGLPGDAATIANDVFRNKVRFIGAGVIGVAAIWTLLKIIGPVIAGIRSSIAASAAKRSGATLALGERDLPIGIVAIVSLKPGADVTPDDVIAYCKERLAAYKYPREVRIVDELPKGPTGKILKKELRG